MALLSRHRSNRSFALGLIVLAGAALLLSQASGLVAAYLYAGPALLIAAALIAVVLALIARRLRRERFLKMSFAEIDGLDGASFEQLAAEVFRARGFKVADTPYSGDSGCDLLLTGGGHRIAVQAKRYAKNVGVRAVQEAVASKAVYGAQHAAVVTNAFFTRQAKKLAAANDVELIDRERLSRLLINARGMAR